MFILVNRGKYSNTLVDEYWLDSSEELINLPKSAPTYSIAVIPRKGEIFYKNEEGLWLEFGYDAE